MSDFDAAFDIVVGLEGGYSNDPRDPGGETMWGITARVARENGYTGPMRDLQKADAKVIYRRRYWFAICGDALPQRWAVAAFDSAVNQGPRVAIECMQAGLQVTVDGVIGPKTLMAISNAGDYQFRRFMAARAVRYASTPNFDRFGLGWMTRLITIAQVA